MATITFQGNPINTSGELPKLGSKAIDFKLVAADLSEKSLKDFESKNVVLNIFPSIDTGTCAASVRRFNKEATKLDDTVVLCISKDLPFAQQRFCAAEGIENVLTLSEFRDENFSDNYQLKIMDGPLKGLMSRAVVVIDKDRNIIHTEQVGEIADEPNYEAALNALK